MGSDTLANVSHHARLVVRRAAKPGGSLEKQTFTMNEARHEVCESLGLAPDAFDDDKAARKAVKDAVNAALALDDEAEEDISADEDDAQRDDEQESEPGPSKKSVKAKKAKTASTSKPAGKGKKKRIATPSPELSEEEGEASASEKEDGKACSSRQLILTSQAASPAPSSSSMSSVYDEPPAKRRASGGSEKKGRKKAAPQKDDGLTGSEAKVAELKRIVTACGLRKQWSKEFADCPTPKSQVTHLLSMLQTIGMEGKPTVNKAKALKERRELAAELNDIQDFEAARGASDSAPRTRRSRQKIASYSEEELSEGEPVEDNKDSAMAAIMDFFSDDESD